ncbi:MAG: glycosyltransferase, partial [Evtepia sp.]
MLSSLWGILETFGLFNLVGQGYEKLILNPKRYRGNPGTDTLVPLPHSKVSLPADSISAPKTVFLAVHRFPPDSTGGTEQFTKNLATHLQAQGHHVIIFAYSARARKKYDHKIGAILYTEETVNNLVVIRFRHIKAPFGILKDFFEDDVDFAAFAATFFDKYHPDIVHFTHLSRINGLATACRKNGIPYLVTLTDFFAVCHYSTSIDRTGHICPGSQCGMRCAHTCRTAQVRCFSTRYQNAVRLLKGAVAVAAPSDYVATLLERECPTLQIAVVPHGIDLPRPSVQKSSSVTKFAFVGTLTEIKGLPLLLSAFRQLPPDCTLSIYGDGNPAYVAQMKRAAKSDSRIQFCGPLPPERISEAYVNADCVVVPSLWPETYNFVLREALQCGCLVVAARIGAMPEAVIEHKNGFLFTAGDETALEAALQQACHFDWTDYVPAEMPSCQEESALYASIYSAQCTQPNLKKDMLS